MIPISNRLLCSEILLPEDFIFDALIDPVWIPKTLCYVGYFLSFNRVMLGQMCLKFSLQSADQNGG